MPAGFQQNSINDASTIPFVFVLPQKAPAIYINFKNAEAKAPQNDQQVLRRDANQGLNWLRDAIKVRLAA